MDVPICPSICVRLTNETTDEMANRAKLFNLLRDHVDNTVERFTTAAALYSKSTESRLFQNEL